MDFYSHKNKGFTLVELMVVIAIIAVLAAIIIPVYSRARETARQTTCMGNLHAIAIALKNYLLDEGGYPPDYNPFTGEGGVTQLYLSGYLNSTKVLRCPNDNTKLQEYINANDIDVNAPAEAVWDPADTGPDYFAERYSSYNQYFGGVDEAYPLYNSYGYRGHQGCGGSVAPDDFNDTPFGTGPSEDELIAMAGANEWMRRVYCDQDHPYYDATDALVVFDRDPYKPDGVTPDLYARPLWDADRNSYTAYFPGLVNSNAPDYTIITHCPWHRIWFGRGLKEKDLAVRLSGDTDTLLVRTYDWVVQKTE
ncbi:MAG: prepilin-type N-terminal cleavage/methylation domain-containing protein [Armatimonadetes bacterium]|nr:prepilin-type N-terminal cleavage/methylation domain-containing protein [Armatimonadota bacterium]NIM23705.1 prepilin-type N-terminal cleavage/methylation domain-containing protein [Armatimonadota bacterium]NIM67582.1 prepilin-type N-terminal cleavage/methylation domain-containing protein [Armatimonadota bacterium]NIM76105.1 prepilin-type N-terminal cleavage/methylation domain-containing protein [Armatimonadota bacterium]NIN05788.1 prepilin-type N-terminal cleavage/methylation domain-contain